MSVYSKAIDVLREGGWTRRTLHNEKNEHCLLGALYAAAGHDMKAARQHPLLPVFSYVGQAIREVVGDTGHSYRSVRDPSQTIYMWNDHDAKDVDDVIHLLKRAEELSEEDK